MAIRVRADSGPILFAYWEAVNQYILSYVKHQSNGVPDPTSHEVEFYLPRQNRPAKREIQYVLEMITCDPSRYKVDHPHLKVSNLMEHFIGQTLLWNTVKKITVIYYGKIHLPGTTPVELRSKHVTVYGHCLGYFTVKYFGYFLQ